MIVCPTPGCDAVLRRVPGLHQPGEPYMQSDGDAFFMLCLKCGARVPWQDDGNRLGVADLGGYAGLSRPGDS